MQEELEPEEIRAGCKARILRLLNTRERCISEMKQRLSSDGYPSELVEELLSWAIDCNLLNEQRFAEAYIAGKKSLGWGRERIERELLSRDVDPFSLSGYPEAFFDEDGELERARAMASRVASGKPDRRQAVYKRLLSKGFSSSIASQVAHECSSAGN